MRPADEPNSKDRAKIDVLRSAKRLQRQSLQQERLRRAKQDRVLLRLQAALLAPSRLLQDCAAALISFVYNVSRARPQQGGYLPRMPKRFDGSAADALLPADSHKHATTWCPWVALMLVLTSNSTMVSGGSITPLHQWTKGVSDQPARPRDQPGTPCIPRWSRGSRGYPLLQSSTPAK